MLQEGRGDCKIQGGKFHVFRKKKKSLAAHQPQRRVAGQGATILTLDTLL